MHWKALAAGLALWMVIGGVACNRNPRNPEVKAEVERLLEAAGLQDVDTDQDVEKGVVTLTGEVSSESDKERAEEIAQSASAGQIIANEISVRPFGMESQMEDTQSALDDGIEDNYKAELSKNRLEGVNYDSREGVLTLTGTVDTQTKRQQAEKLAASVPNVKQVVNMIDVTQKATTTTP